MSTVSQSASYPADAARVTSSLTNPRSFHVYTWNHLGPSAAAATSSMLYVLIVDSEYGTPARPAARATASSPSELVSRVYPVGARMSGIGSRFPNSDVVVSISLTSRNTLGRNSIRPNAPEFCASVRSSSAAPST